MRKWKTVLSGVIVIGGLFIARTGYTVTIPAQSAARGDVQSAVNSAVSGDIVLVPAGTATWTEAVTIPSTKKITLQGAGMGVTKINRSPQGTAVDLLMSGSRLTGFSFTEGVIVVDGDGWRIDHCELVFAAFTSGIRVSGSREDQHPVGVIDRCVCTNMRVSVHGWNGLLAHKIWAQPLALGTNNAVFVEDNIFTGTVHSNAMDGNYGCRYVFRYNTLNDIYVEAHSVQGTHRAARSWEIYHNTLIRQTAQCGCLCCCVVVPALSLITR